MRAIREELRATRESGQDILRKETLEDLLAKMENLSPEEIMAGNLCIEGLADEL